MRELNTRSREEPTKVARRAGSARAEWARYWYIPLTAALGNSTSGLQLFGIGSFIAALQAQFGWTRAMIMSGAAIVSVGVALSSVPMGLLIDRWGSRRVGLLGVPLMAGAVALLGTASGTMMNWWLLWTLISACAGWVQAPVWTNPVVCYFDKGRGTALGLTLSGASFAIFLMPLLTTWLVASLGWRAAFFALGGIWTMMCLPMLLAFFRSPLDAQGDARSALELHRDALTGTSLAKALRTSTLYKLLLASAFFALAVIGTVVHFVPLLTDRGMTPYQAASIASLIGIFSIIGTLGTGSLLDRFPGHIVGAIVFLLPIPGCVLLLTHGLGLTGCAIAAALFGLTLGADADVITYMATRHFGLRHYGAIQGPILGFTAVGAAAGPLSAAAVYDQYGSYALFLGAVMLLMMMSALMISSSGLKRLDCAVEEGTGDQADTQSSLWISKGST